MKILITGTHLTPALAVIEELKKNYHPEIVYVGRNTTLEGDETPSVESQILPKLGVKFIPLIAGRLQRTFTIYTIPSLFKIPIGLLQSLYIIFSEKPDVVLSFGGYVAVPVIIAAWLFSIPIIIHEQALVPGLANKISAPFANKVTIAFDNPDTFDRKSTLVVGNTIREEIVSFKKFSLSQEFKSFFARAKRKKMPIILITGGNQGSHAINMAIKDGLDEISKSFSIIHQTGSSSFNDYKNLKVLENDRYLVVKWIDKEIGQILSKVDLVICRAGINTLTEISYFGKPTLIIPIPFQKEQNKNAEYFEGLGLAKVLPQVELSGKNLLQGVKQIVNNTNYSKSRVQNLKKIINPDAAKRLALETVLSTYEQ